MIYLIGGTPRSGKSTLARMLGKKFNIQLIATDDLRPVVMPYFKGEEVAKRFPLKRPYDSAGITNFYETNSAREILNADISEANAMWPGIRSLILHLTACRRNCIIEGGSIFPRLTLTLDDEVEVQSIFLVKLDVTRILDGLLQNASRGDWLVDNIKSEGALLAAARAISLCGEYIQTESARNGLRCINTENDFREKLQDAGDNMTMNRF